MATALRVDKTFAVPGSSKFSFCAVLALIVALAYFSLFGFFSVHDDEGYNVAMVRLVAEGVPLYTSQYAYHGPIPYFIKALLLTTLGVPITHESLRLVVLSVWLLSSLLITGAIWNLTGKWTASVAGLLLVGSHLYALRFSPGHPEDFVVLFLSLATYLASTERLNRSEYSLPATLGLIGALLVGTKINVGIFYLLGISLWMLAQYPKTKLGMALRAFFIACATAVPLMLMQGSRLAEWQLLLVSTLSILLTCSAVLLYPIQARFGLKQVLVCTGSVLLGLAGIVVAAMIHGSRLPDIVDAVIVTAAKHPNVFLRPISFGFFTVPILALFLFVCVSQFVRMARTRWAVTPVPSMLKIILALTALLFAVVKLVEYYMPLVGPVCWLIVFPCSTVPLKAHARTSRLLIASMAVFQILEAYPVKGSQTAWSTLLLSVCCLMLLYDGIVELSRRPAGVPKPVAALIYIVASLTLIFPLIMTEQLWSAYYRSPGLGFNDSRLIRIPPGLKAQFDWVVASTSRYCDVIVTQPGLNSFLLWSKSRGETIRGMPVLITGWPLILTDEQERETTTRVQQATSVCAVYSRSLSDWWTNDGPHITESSMARQPLVSYIHDLHHVQEIGDYEIRGNGAAVGKWNEDYLLNGIRCIEGGRNAVGIPADLMRHADAGLIFGFQASRAGPLVSVQQAGAKTDEDTRATEPLIYIASDGILMTRNGLEPSSRSVSSSVLDGLWHELILHREKQDWQISLDRRPIGRLSDFLAGTDAPRYLQLGPALVAKGSALRAGWNPFFGKLSDVRVRKATFVSQPWNATK